MAHYIDRMRKMSRNSLGREPTPNDIFEMAIKMPHDQLVRSIDMMDEDNDAEGGIDNLADAVERNEYERAYHKALTLRNALGK
jgi:hypothetical protein